MRGRYPRHCRNQRSERFGDESFIRQGPILIQVGATESTPICTKNVPTTVRHQPIARLTRKRPQSTSLPWRCQARGSGRTHTRRPPSGPAGPLLRQHASTCRRPSRATCTPHPCVPAQRGPARASPTLTSRRTRRGRLRWRTPSRMAPDTPEWSGLQAAQTRHRTAKPGKLLKGERQPEATEGVQIHVLPSPRTVWPLEVHRQARALLQGYLRPQEATDRMGMGWPDGGGGSQACPRTGDAVDAYLGRRSERNADGTDHTCRGDKVLEDAGGAPGWKRRRSKRLPGSSGLATGASGATGEPIDRPPGQLFAVDADKDPSIPLEPAHAPAGRKAGWKHIGTSMGERPRPQIVPQ